MLADLLVILTFTAPDLGAVEQAYSSSLGYEVVERGRVEEALAKTWGAPRSAGRDYILLRPESEAPYYLRFVQGGAVDGYVPMKTFGWNAAEILVQDPDELARRMRAENSAFRIVGEPRPLSATSDIRAMQVVGPANEVLYLTRIPPPEPGDGDALRAATTFVDRAFIVILGGPEMDAMREFYAKRFHVPVSQPAMGRVTVLNKAHGFDIDQTHPLAMARLAPDFAIELDGYPETATERQRRDGELPPAMAIVSIQVDDLEEYSDLWLADPLVIDAFPYHGERIAVIKGAVGELIELIETVE